MFVCKIENACKEWGDTKLFEQVSLEIGEGEKVVLFGPNGAGKTTLIKAIMGHISLDGGAIRRAIPLSEWGWLEQAPTVSQEISVKTFVMQGSQDVYAAHRRLLAAQMGLEQSSSFKGSETMRAVDVFTEAQETYMSLGGYEWEANVESSLMRMGLPRSVWKIPYLLLSGGQKTRAQIARLMVRRPRMLVLDEPTNHLDAETLSWLESWLRGYDGTVLMVTHDRWFMDQVADATIALRADGTQRYKGGYSAFRTQHELEVQTQLAAYEKQQRGKQQLQEAIQQYRQWYDRAHAAAGERNPFMKKRAMKNATRFQAKERALERLEQQPVERPRVDPLARIDFQDGQFEARTLTALHGVSVEFASGALFRDVHLDVRRGDRIAIIGPNGAGKTTLLKVLTGQLAPTTGHVRHSPQLRIGYFDQELQRLNASDTVLGTILSIPGMTHSYARTILATFLFDKKEVFRPIAQLSMGEQCRLAFVQLYLTAANLLVLDEPTNYLDIDTRERVEDALMQYPGALVMVSHDRYLVRKVANRILHLENGVLTDFSGSYEAYKAWQEDGDKCVSADRRDEIRRLELLLTQLIGAEPADSPESGDDLQIRIADVRRQLNNLRSGAFHATKD